MNTEILEGKWTELKGKIKTKWGKFNDDDIESFKGNLDQLVGKIEKTYGYAKDVAEKEYNDFKTSLQSAKKTASEKISSITGK